MGEPEENAEQTNRANQARLGTPLISTRAKVRYPKFNETKINRIMGILLVKAVGCQAN
jgi:hypothetical protein